MRTLLRLLLVIAIVYVCCSLVLGSATLVAAITAPFVRTRFGLGETLLSPFCWGSQWSGLMPPLGVVIGPALVLAMLICLVLVAIKILKGGTSKNHERAQAEESRTMQELYQGFSRMEERVEALETILLERVARRKAPARKGE